LQAPSAEEKNHQVEQRSGVQDDFQSLAVSRGQTILRLLWPDGIQPAEFGRERAKSAFKERTDFERRGERNVIDGHGGDAGEAGDK
jgi:hypothetical protein